MPSAVPIARPALQGGRYAPPSRIGFVRTLSLPTRDELFGLFSELVHASGLDRPRALQGLDGQPSGSPFPFWNLASLSPAQANPDFEVDFGQVSDEGRAFLQRQVDRSHRDRMRSQGWQLPEGSLPRLTDWRIRDREGGFGVFVFEVPLVWPGGRRVILRGARCESNTQEDFEFRLERGSNGWTRC